MKWSLKELDKYRNEPLQIDETLDVKVDMMDRFDDRVIDIDPVKVVGSITVDRDDVLLDVHVSGQMVVPSSRSLEPAAFPFDFDMNEIYITEDSHFDRYEENETVLLLETQTIDLNEGVIDNIIAQIPMQILTDAERNGEDLPTGNGWSVISEDDYKADQEENQPIDPRLAKLKGLFPDQDQDRH
ncbi:YceD family protein [Furfurilactobacillus sp. WILCCON 0119]|uniref:YceD family protein n=1 Tax=Furfurilactobacillus entadae TaxID=2922307 RepID=UPI0035EA3251